MPISDTNIFSMLRTRMQWHQERQRVLSENVSNADTPKFRPRDLTPPKMDRPQMGITEVSLAQTASGHIAGSSNATAFQSKAGGYDIRPSGNAVNLEDEMMKVANNQMDYQTATTLYTRSLSLIKTAVGKR